MKINSSDMITALVLAGTLILAVSLTFMVERDIPQGTSFSIPNSGFKFPYVLSSHQEKHLLPSSLVEISGISWKGNEQVLAVQDEKGSIYIYDLQKEEIVKKVKFGKNGDYEGIARAGDITYVLKSNGNVFRVDTLNEDKVDSEQYKTELSTAEDAEGLAYEPRHDRLLIALKAEKIKNDGEQGGSKRAIYGFYLKENRLSEEPVYLIDQLELGRLIYKKEKSYTFMPSGIAIHPDTGHIYVLASVGKLLLVLNRRGKLVYAERLDSGQLPQPEGIAFAPDGRLLLASEGKGGKGRILVFKQQ